IGGLAASREKRGASNDGSNCRLQKETAWDGFGPLRQIIDHDWPSSTWRPFAGSPYLKAGYWSKGGLRASAAIRFSRFSPNRISPYWGGGGSLVPLPLASTQDALSLATRQLRVMAEQQYPPWCST